MATNQTSQTVDLADVGARVPTGTTCEVRSVPTGYEVSRRGEQFVLESVTSGLELTGVIGRGELPTRVPDWLSAVVRAECGAEVRLGR